MAGWPRVADLGTRGRLPALRGQTQADLPETGRRPAPASAERVAELDPGRRRGVLPAVRRCRDLAGSRRRPGRLLTERFARSAGGRPGPGSAALRAADPIVGRRAEIASSVICCAPPVHLVTLIGPAGSARPGWPSRSPSGASRRSRSAPISLVRRSAVRVRPPGSRCWPDASGSSPGASCHARPIMERLRQAVARSCGATARNCWRRRPSWPVPRRLPGVDRAGHQPQPWSRLQDEREGPLEPLRGPPPWPTQVIGSLLAAPRGPCSRCPPGFTLTPANAAAVAGSAGGWTASRSPSS